MSQANRWDIKYKKTSKIITYLWFIAYFAIIIIMQIWSKNLYFYFWWLIICLGGQVSNFLMVVLRDREESKKDVTNKLGASKLENRHNFFIFLISELIFLIPWLIFYPFVVFFHSDHFAYAQIILYLIILWGIKKWKNKKVKKAE